jgi:hypothetical protein
MYCPVVTVNGECIVHRNVALTYQYALLTGWCIMALRDIHWLYAREMWRDVFRGSFERIGQPDAAKAMDFKYDCKILEFRRKS